MCAVAICVCAAFVSVNGGSASLRRAKWCDDAVSDSQRTDLSLLVSPEQDDIC